MALNGNALKSLTSVETKATSKFEQTKENLLKLNF